jgi:hypothetical protein
MTLLVIKYIDFSSQRQTPNGDRKRDFDMKPRLLLSWLWGPAIDFILRNNKDNQH